MPARKKTLDDLVRDRTFLARRHVDLLESSPLVDNPTLRTLQASWRTEPSDLKRQDLARLFEKAVRTEAGVPVLTMAEILHATIGPTRVDEPLERSWRTWDRRFGFSWRIQNDAAHNGDRIRAFWLLARRRERDLNRIDKLMPDLLERARTELELGQAPDPPGIEGA